MGFGLQKIKKMKCFDKHPQRIRSNIETNFLDCKLRMNLTPVPQVLLQLPQDPQFFHEESLPWMKLDKYKNMFFSGVKLAAQLSW